MTLKLSDTQLVLLSAAAQREDRCLVASQHLKGGAAKKVADKLIATGLVREIRAKPDAPVWRRDEEGRSFSLKLTAAGLKAIAVDEPDAQDGEQTEEGSGDAAPMVARRTSGSRGRAKASSTANDRSSSADEARASSVASSASTRSSAQPRDGTKLAAVIALLGRAEGATLDELTEATGWLPHTTRAALTGLRKRNYMVSRTRGKGERGSVYRIVLQQVGAALEQAEESAGEASASRAPSNAPGAPHGDGTAGVPNLGRAA